MPGFDVMSCEFAHDGLCATDVELRDHVADVHVPKVSCWFGRPSDRGALQVLPRLKGLLIRLLGENVTATLHSLRFAYRIRFVDPVEPDLAIVARFLSAGDCVVDVGANGADWSAVLARAVGRGGRVFAFEADPYYARVTRRALIISGLRRVEVFGFGLSNADTDGHLQVVFDDGLRAAGLGQLVARESVNTVPIALRRLDSVLAEIGRGQSPRLIKCDVEGHERQVLEGAIGCLASRPIVIAELYHLGLASDTSADVSSFLSPLGYRTFVVNEERTSLVPEETYRNIPEFPNRWFLAEADVEHFRRKGLLTES